jgi:hypothetical protein
VLLGASMAEWLRLLTSNHLPLTAVRIPTGTLDCFMWGSYPASLRNVSVSTQVPVCAWNNVQKSTWGLPPPVRLERRHMTYTVSVWHKTQLNKHIMCYYDKKVLNKNILVCVISFLNMIYKLYARKKSKHWLSSQTGISRQSHVTLSGLYLQLVYKSYSILV